MSAYFWLGAEGEVDASPEPAGVRHLTDLFRRLSMLEFEVVQLKARPPSWPPPTTPSLRDMRAGWPRFPPATSKAIGSA